jgi:hypothetical protein
MWAREVACSREGPAGKARVGFLWALVGCVEGDARVDRERERERESRGWRR